MAVETKGNPLIPTPPLIEIQGRQRAAAPSKGQVAQVAQIFGRVNTLSGSVRTESVSAEFSTTASEP